MTPPGAATPGRRIAVVLAAGEGRRFGGAKQLAPFRGRPLLRHAIDAVAGRDDVDGTIVVLGAHAEAIVAGVELGDVTVVRCEDWARGPSASLSAGLAAAVRAGADEVLVTLGDQPLLPAATLDRVLAVAGEVVRAVHGGRPGHPVLLRGAAIAHAATLDDEARRTYLAGAARTVDVADVDDGADVDRPADLDALQP